METADRIKDIKADIEKAIGKLEQSEDLQLAAGLSIALGILSRHIQEEEKLYTKIYANYDAETIAEKVYSICDKSYLPEIIEVLEEYQKAEEEYEQM